MARKIATAFLGGVVAACAVVVITIDTMVHRHVRGYK